MLNDSVKVILNTFVKNGYEAYVVGGAIRNYLLNKKIYDYDITTNALPSDIQNLFENTVPTGIKFGTVTVFIDNIGYEVTTFRKDGEYLDFRRPKKVEFSTSLEEDLQRRDFTINALCMDIDENIIDIFGGRHDIDNKIIKCIGNPDERFNEDALRMLRAIRFMCVLEFKIENDTLLSIKRNNMLIKNISVERIVNELNKIFLSNKPSDGIRVLLDTGLIEYILPEMINCVGYKQHNPYHDKDVFEHIMSVLDNIEPKLNLRLAALLHDISKPECFTIDNNGVGHFYGHHKKSSEVAKEILKRLKYSNEMITDVCTLIRYHYLKEVDMKDKGVKRFINSVGKERLDDMFRLNIADIKGKKNSNNFSHVEVLRKKCKLILERKEPMCLKDLAINGNDLKNLGIPTGRIYSELLNKTMEYVIDKPDKNNKNELIDYIKSLINNLNR